MKKELMAFLFISTFSLIIASCDDYSSDSVSSIDSSMDSSIQEIDSPLFLSEFVCGSSSANRALEIGNSGSDSVSLEGYKINYYQTNSTTPYYTYSFSGVIEGNSTIVIVDDGAYNQTLINKANIIDKVYSIGSWPIQLAYQTQTIDVLGYIGYSVDYGSSMSLVRKTSEFDCSGVFEPYKYVSYNADDYDYLGNLTNSLTNVELFSGPHLEESNFSLSYADSTTLLGTGGVAEVTVKSYGDGDTTSFYYPQVINSLGYSDGTGYRYQNINTPETQHGDDINAQPWGVAAKNWNNDLLKNAKSILIQSIKGGTLTETYDRLLGFVWFSNVSNPSPVDYINLNFLTVQAGFSEVHFSSVASSTMIYKDLSYYSYLIDAQNYAKMMGLKIYGEVDPDFDY
jgi:endonuclease YncB( thermonuclease family)